MAEPAAVRQAGIYLHDTRHLSRYGAGTFGDLELIQQRRPRRTLTQYWSRMRHHAQEVLLVRELELVPSGLSRADPRSRAEHRGADAAICGSISTRISPTSSKRAATSGRAPRNAIERRRPAVACAYVAQDGVASRRRASISAGCSVHAPLIVPPRESSTSSSSRSTFDNDAARGASAAAARRRRAWHADRSTVERRARVLRPGDRRHRVAAARDARGPNDRRGHPQLRRALRPRLADHRVAAARCRPGARALGADLSRGAAGQTRGPVPRRGAGQDHARASRERAVSRIGELPFRTYYGSADSTPLFLVLLGDYVARTGDTALAQAARAQLARGDRLDREAIADARGLINFRQRADGKGLTVQSWKDCADSMSYADGRLGEGGLAVAEVQGYVFAALQRGGRSVASSAVASRRERAGWLARSGEAGRDGRRAVLDAAADNYALALDDDGPAARCRTRPTAGHLLWSGIVPEDKAQAGDRAAVRATICGRATGCARCRPRRSGTIRCSYHNGSVWPHDTALFAAGLRRYGDAARASRGCARALVALAGHSADLRLPELVGGYAREGDTPPLPYIESCRPQAWAAAALIYVANGALETVCTRDEVSRYSGSLMPERMVDPGRISVSNPSGSVAPSRRNTGIASSGASTCVPPRSRTSAARTGATSGRRGDRPRATSRPPRSPARRAGRGRACTGPRV